MVYHLIWCPRRRKPVLTGSIAERCHELIEGKCQEKGWRIFRYAKYKAYNAGILTSRVNPRNTSRECARCHSLVARYEEGKEAVGYTYGAPLVLCSGCEMRGNADRNASLVIGQRLVTRYQQKEKPQTLRRVSRDTGVVVCQDAQSVGGQPSTEGARHADANEHGTAQEGDFRMYETLSDIAHQLRFPLE